MSINEIKNKPWVYRLFDTGDGYILGVVFCSSRVDVTRGFKLELDSIDDDYLSAKAEDVVNNYEIYKSKEVDLPD